MESIVKFLEKGQPYFDKVSKNIYLQAIKDGFLAAMPIILSSSVFLLISTLPGVVATVGGFTLPDWWNVDVVNFCNKVYNFTMGVVGIMVAGTTASALAGSKNRRMPAGKAINATSTMVAAMCAMLILAVTQTSAKIDGADVSVFFTDNMGTKGLLSSFVAAFATVNIYAFCIKRDITIKLPKEVPGAHRPELPRHLRLQLLHPVCRRHRRYLPHLLGRPVCQRHLHAGEPAVRRCRFLRRPRPHLVHDPSVLVHGHPRPLGR